MASDSAFQLHCDIINSQFILFKSGEKWQQIFKSFEAAYDYVEAHIANVESLMLCNVRGELLVEMTIAPLPVDYFPRGGTGGN